jgi:hypothetical protein
MRVLVVESDRGTATKAIMDLRDAGHQVERCHEQDLPAFPCNALCDAGVCPLDSPEGVDVVLDYRSRPHPRPTPFEDGVSCALRRHVPLVVAGTSALNPFDSWTSAIAADADLVEVCEQTAGYSLEHLAAPARAEVRRVLENTPDLATRSDVIVRRSRGALNAVVELPREAEEVESRIAVAVAGVLRAHDRTTRQINVAVRRLEAASS